MRETLKHETRLTNSSRFNRMLSKQRIRQSNRLRRPVFSAPDSSTKNKLNIEEVQTTVQNLIHSKLSERKESLKKMRKFLSRGDCDEVVEVLISFPQANLFYQCLVTELCNKNDLENQIEAAWCLTNLSCVSETVKQCVVAAPYLISFAKEITFQRMPLAKQSLLALGNMAGEGVEIRRQLLQFGILEVLFGHLYGNSKLLPTAIWCLSNIILDIHEHEKFFAMGLMDRLMSLLGRYGDSEKEDVLVDLLWSFVSITSGENIQSLGNYVGKLAPALMRILSQNKSDSFQVPTLRIIGNILRGPDEWIDYLLSFDTLLPILDHHLTLQSSSVRESCYVIANISGGTSEHVKRLLDFNNLVQKLHQLMQSDNLQITREISYFVTNVCSDGVNIEPLLIHGGFFPLLVRVTEISFHAEIPDEHHLELLLRFLFFVAQVSNQCKIYLKQRRERLKKFNVQRFSNGIYRELLMQLINILE